ncbi:MAG: RHS repeat-associated core domain-containing protein, partial [Clostridia bacterium]|nr:RHS repeat-associated core domain-containing protein [Clostridia bacterium]
NGSTLAGFRLYITEGVDTQEYLVSFMYDENGEPFGFTVNGDSYYYVRNAQNDIFLIVDSDNQGVVLYQYDAWGNITSCYDTTGGLISLINPYTYRGYYYDIETGYYYLNSRYYSPQLHRFISADNEYVSTATPMAMTDKNLFAYCDNNPVVRADDGGQFWNIIVGAAVGGALEIVGQLISGKSVKELNWAKIGVSALSGGLTAAVGPLAGCLISGATDVAMDALDGNINSLGDAAKSFAWGTAKAAISYGVGTAIGKATKSLSKIDKVGKLGKESYPGVKYSYNKGSGRAIRSIELHPRHNGHGIHLQGNKWNPVTNTRTSTFFRKTFWR